MRYDTPVYFQVKRFQFDAETGDYIEIDPIEYLRMASVVGTNAETMRQVYGEIRQGSKTIHLQYSFNLPFHTIRIGDKSYSVDNKICHRTKATYIVTEV